jgi:hypothetical protein
MRIIRHTSPHLSRRRRGTAEVELLLATMYILIPVLLITGAMLVLGPSRVLNAYTPHEEAFLDATISPSPPSMTDIEVNQSDIPLVDPGDAEAEPHLDQLQQANRVHQATTSDTITLHFGKWVTLSPVTLTSKSEFISPSWAYSSFPDPDDQQNLVDWAEMYADESTALSSNGSPSPQDALMLQDAWPP